MFNFKIVNHTPNTFQVDYPLIRALSMQITNHFAPIWGVSATINGGGIPNCPLFIEENADVAGALGYHDIDGAGVPFIKVFVKDSADAGVPLSSVMSHELLEVLGDAFVESLTLRDNGDGTGTLYEAEACDPVEADSYLIRGNVVVSNFITPFWFMDPVPNGVKFDFMGRLTAPFSLTPGGYFGFRRVTHTGLGVWEQATDRARPWKGTHKRHKR